MREKMFMVLWGLTLFSIGLATFLMFRIVGLLESNHTLLMHISKVHVGVLP